MELSSEELLFCALVELNSLGKFVTVNSHAINDHGKLVILMSTFELSVKANFIPLISHQDALYLLTAHYCGALSTILY